MNMKKKNIITEYEIEYEGQKVIVHKYKTKDKKTINNIRGNFINCPNCLSKMIVDNSGIQKCSGDRLGIWDSEFTKFDKLAEVYKIEYIKTLANDSMFFELYDRWNYAKNNQEETFDCGYSNKIFFPIASCSIIIPDPAQVVRIERKLGRKLTEEEIFGEKELFSYKGSIFEEYRDGARTIKISLLRFPEDC